MQTGFNQVDDNAWKDEYIHNCLILLDIFTKDSIKMAATYCNHAGRQGITAEDINLAMMVRAFHGDIFWNSPDIQQRIQESMDDNMFYEAAESEGVSDTNKVSEATEQWTKSNDNCAICQAMNEFNQYPDKWYNWNPDSREMLSVKNAINKAIDSSRMQ